MPAIVLSIVLALNALLVGSAHAGHILTGEALTRQAALNPGVKLEDVDFIGGSVSRAIFTRAVVNSEPVDNLDFIPGELQFLYYFTELKGFAGNVITHRWELNGKTVAESRFEIGGPRWRIWSSRPLPPKNTGHWRVVVEDAQGRVVAVSDFVHGATASAAGIVTQ
jgi:hypothetical protein